MNNKKPASFMIGAIAGDIIGSPYEFIPHKSKDFPLWSNECEFTDDTVMSIAIYKAISEYIDSGKTINLHEELLGNVVLYGGLYPDYGYGVMFANFLNSNNHKPYNSFGNGSAMRVSAAGFLAESVEEAVEYAIASAEISHNHPEGIKGAVAIATAIYLAKNKISKEDIRNTLSQYYNLSFTFDEIRPSYKFNETCQGSVPQAIVAFLESTGYEDAIRNAVSLGGDADTLGAMTGSIAAAYYGVPEEIEKETIKRLDEFMLETLGYDF